MRIIIVGASGTIGKRLTEVFGKEHEVVSAGSKSGDLRVDIGVPSSISDLYQQAGAFDALISVTGNGHFAPLNMLADDNFRIGIDSKLMGQVNLVLIGQHYINPGGSFTLTSGILSEDPIRTGTNLTVVNRGIEGFAMAAATELGNGVRINVVSPGVVEDSPDYFPFFPGHEPVKMDRVVKAYMKSVLGPQTGQTIKVW
jgi:NAD(P)-dependent dehydrogenase (short-subunit alcohol dehydrogenase family)